MFYNPYEEVVVDSLTKHSTMDALLDYVEKTHIKPWEKHRDTIHYHYYVIGLTAFVGLAVAMGLEYGMSIADAFLALVSGEAIICIWWAAWRSRRMYTGTRYTIFDVERAYNKRKEMELAELRKRKEQAQGGALSIAVESNGGELSVCDGGQLTKVGDAQSVDGVGGNESQPSKVKRDLSYIENNAGEPLCCYCRVNLANYIIEHIPICVECEERGEL